MVGHDAFKSLELPFSAVFSRLFEAVTRSQDQVVFPGCRDRAISEHGTPIPEFCSRPCNIASLPPPALAWLAILQSDCYIKASIFGQTTGPLRLALPGARFRHSPNSSKNGTGSETACRVLRAHRQRKDNHHDERHREILQCPQGFRLHSAG